MQSNDIRKSLKRASREIREACDDPAVSGSEPQLTGFVEQLRYVAEGNAADPEATIHPSRGALDTIQRRLTDVIDRTDDEAVAAQLRRAREQILLVIVTLEEGWKKQHDHLSE